MDNIEPNFAILTLTDSKIISFFSGIGEKTIGKSDHIVALILRRDEKPLRFREILSKCAAKILSVSEENEYIKIFPEIFKEMTRI